MIARKHTPIPYVCNGFGGGFHVVARTEPHGVAISAGCKKPPNNEIETARFIVDACNSNAALVAALEKIRRECDSSSWEEIYSMADDALKAAKGEA